MFKTKLLKLLILIIIKTTYTFLLIYSIYKITKNSKRKIQLNNFTKVTFSYSPRYTHVTGINVEVIL